MTDPTGGGTSPHAAGMHLVEEAAQVADMASASADHSKVGAALRTALGLGLTVFEAMALSAAISVQVAFQLDSARPQLGSLAIGIMTARMVSDAVDVPTLASVEPAGHG